MYLKALEIQGFKSFADKTRLTFEKDITAIVGPNGSGKSNISDAILWVMGEQRSKALRGTKMEDVIFGGTEKRNKLGYAEVSLIIDNSAHIFDSDLPEIVLTRKYYRSGESEYFINRESVRLKDLNSLLMDTGLGRDGYSIIGQGRIAEIISTRSTDRREVFEEAAGISRYRYRKEEAERKLEKTEENLLRVNDKIEELELQVGPLKKQAEVAKKYLALREQLKTGEISLWMESLDQLRAKSEALRLEYEQAETQLEKARTELSGLYASADSILQRMQDKEVEIEGERASLSQKEGEVASIDADIAVLNTSLQHLKSDKERTLQDIAERETRTAELEEKILATQERIAGLNTSLTAIEEELKRCDNVIQGCRLKLTNREEIQNQLSTKVSSLTVDYRTAESRLRLLEEMEKDFEGFSKAVKVVMREAGRGNLSGIHGPVSSLLRADAECALAIETALGAAGQNIIVDTQNDGRLAIELLKRQDSGRATFLPIETIRGSVMKDAPERDPGFVGIAYDLVRFDEQYEQIFANLLGRTIVAETMTDAVRMSKNSGYKLRIVTLDGQQINAGGSLTGGSSAKSSGILSRANELEKLRKTAKRMQQDLKQATADLESAKTKVAQLRYQLDTALEDKNAQVTEQRAVLAERSALELTVTQFKALLAGLSDDSDTRKRLLSSYDSREAELNSQIDGKNKSLSARKAEAEGIKAKIQALSSEKLTLEGKRTKNDKLAQTVNASIIELERTVARLEQKKLGAETEEKSLLDKLWDSYELSYTSAAALRKPVINLQKESKDIADLRRQISALGTPNLGAIDEYERVNSRYEFLSEQRDDVLKAKNELVKIIKDVTGEMEAVFITKFKEIDTAFRETFLELFGGGKAALILEDESNILECGIEIKVQPPGKALSTLSLLSGGEMAFVAIALYFAILKVRPTPFCVMDEIEAALDEANVSRYASYMRRMSGNTQFIVITHRRGTMEEADMLYGVTMQEKGVSTVLQLNPEEASKAVEN